MNMDFNRSFRRQLVTWGMILVGVVGAGHAMWQREVLLTQLVTESEKLLRYDGNQRRLQNETKSGVDTPAVSEVVDEISVALRYPWEGMLDSLYTSAGSGLQLVNIQPDPETGRLQVTGKAANADVFLSYMERLRSEGMWYKVEPVFQDRMEEGDSLVFQVRLERRP